MKNKKGKWSVNLNPVKCPNCGLIQPKVRMPKSIREALWGGSTCSKCGTKMDKFGQVIAEK